MRAKWKNGWLAVCLAVVLAAAGLSLQTAARADGSEPPTVGTVTTSTEAGTGLSVQAVNKEKPSTVNRAHLTIDLRGGDNAHNGIVLPGSFNDRYLAIWITGKKNPVQNTLPAVWFYMEGVTANGTTITHVHTPASYRKTAPAFYKDGEDWKPTAVERGGFTNNSTNGVSGRTMFRVTADATLLPAGSGLNKGANLPESVVFLPFATMRAGNNLQTIQNITLSQEVTDDGRFNEYAKISVVTLPGFKVNGNTTEKNSSNQNVEGTQGKYNGFIAAAATDYDAPLAAPADVLAAMQETVLIDFTKLSQADVDTALENGTFATHVTANNLTAKDWFGLTPTDPAHNGPLASTENNATYAQYFRLDAGKEVRPNSRPRSTAPFGSGTVGTRCASITPTAARAAATALWPI